MAAIPKVVRYARHLLDKYDTNRDGRLQPDEWQHLSGHPESIDQDGNGEISFEELTRWIGDYGHRKRIGVPLGIEPTAGAQSALRSDPDGASAAGDKSSDPDAIPPGGRRRDLKFYVPTKRLPAGLPDWFLARDLDGDGQLTAAEYSPTSLASELAEFSNYDLNGDGILTAKECVRKSSGKTSGTSKDPNP